MKKVHSHLGWLTLLLIGCSAPTVQVSPGVQKQATGTAIIDTRIRYQTFDGWGTSLAWWANVAGGWSDPARSSLMDAL